MNGEVISFIFHLLERVLIDEKGREQLIESNKLADVCFHIQNSNKKGNGSRMGKNLAIKSTYFKLRNDKGNMRVSFSRDGMEKTTKARDIISISPDAISDSSLPLDSRFGRGENLEQVDDEESGLKVDGPSRALVERIFDEAEEGFDEDNEDGVVRDGIGSEDEKKEHDQPIKRIGRKKNHFVKSHEEITKVIKAGRVLGFDFNGRENDMIEEIVRRIKAGTFVPTADKEDVIPPVAEPSNLEDSAGDEGTSSGAASASKEKILKAIKGPDKLPDSLTVAQKDDMLEMALGTIILNLFDNVLREVNDETTASSVWNKLESLYLTKSLTNKIYLKERLFSFKMDASKGLGKNLDDQFKKMTIELANVGDNEKLSDENEVIILLNSLPESFKDMKAAIKYGRTSLSFEECISALKSKELELKIEKKDNGKNLFVRSRQPVKNYNNNSNNKNKGRSKTPNHRKLWLYLLKSKDQAFESFKAWKRLVENQISKKLKTLRTDNGFEFCNENFNKFCEEHGITRHRIVRHTPQQNGVAERMNRTVLEKVRCLLIGAGLSQNF
ncbi:hypothetical protein EZV62_005470 [Acer yangbiense]|uniref:Integrase catalytic domain-containing protein n=1 Tax=Acer yangbiense TaxID=1000413 RepID=A0A5C7IMX1_9ROSI|nr:hypothetical protein EZV62_005470 [Acer yangbiense]